MSLKLTPETVLADRYRLHRLIGEGGMGMVWAAHHLVTRKPVALKFLKATSPEMVKRFLREARVAGTVNHPNVVPIHDVVQLDDGTPVMVMDLLSGESLAEKLEREQVLSLPELARTLLPVVSAVGTAHALGIVHRDLKPDNIFLCEAQALCPDVRVLDFGIAKLTATEGDAAQTAGLTTTGSMLGTPYYMAPEQVFGERSIDHRADIWSLGVILYEGLSGRKPIDGENLGQIFKAITLDEVVPLERLVPTLPPSVTSLVRRMLSRAKDERPDDLREVFAVLSAYTEESAQDFGAAVPARPWTPSDPPPGRTPSSRPPPPSRPITPPSGREQIAGPVNPYDPTLGADGANPSQTATSVVVPQRPSRRSALGAAVLGAGLLALGGLGVWRIVRAPVAPDTAAASAPIEVGATSAAAPSEPVAPVAAGPSASDSVGTPHTPGTAPEASAPAARDGARGGPSARSAPVRSARLDPPKVDAPKPPPSAAPKLPGGIHGDSPY